MIGEVPKFALMDMAPPKDIKNSENSVQLELEKVYDELSENYIKPLRRKLPITGTKMNWNVNQINLAQNK